jgi:hypothetical protein
MKEEKPFQIDVERTMGVVRSIFFCKNPIQHLVNPNIFRNFASRNKPINKLITMETIKTINLTEEQKDIAEKLYKENKRKLGNYTLEEVDKEMANVWIADAHSEGDTEYAEFLRKAIAENAELYSLTDHLGGFSQPIGEVAVFN